MIAKRMHIIACFIIIIMSTCAWAETGFDRKNMMRKNEPIEIVSDKMEAFQDKKMVVFSGNVVATQGDTKLKTDHLSIYYKSSNNKKDKIVKQDLEATGNLDKIELKGHVVITQKEMSATGEEAVYYQESAQFVMTGNPVLRQGKNVIKGCKVIVYNDENRGKVEQCEKENSGRVTAIIHPQDKK